MPHTAELIAVGTELLLGGIVNTDAQMLSRELSALGINVHYHTVVGDNPERLRRAVDVARSRADIIITTGGLGPTCDDLTKTVLAECFGKTLVYNTEAAERIETFFRRIGRPLTENNYQQAYLPEGCVPFQNDWGTAPGCAFEAEGVHVLMLPGPPGECGPMFRTHGTAYLRRLAEGVICSRSLRIFGLGESQVEARLRDKMNAMTNPTLAPYAKTGEVELRLTAKAPTEAEAMALIAPAEAELRDIFGPLVYGADGDSLESVVLALLRERGLTLGTAESCTGGLCAKRITDLPGASDVFQGGVVSYTNAVKRDILGVRSSLLERHSAVSPQVAAAMAEGARRVLGCDLALAFTGVAGPGPDGQGHEEGLVYVALAAPDTVWTAQLHNGPTRGRAGVRHISASHGLDMARRWLLGLEQG